MTDTRTADALPGPVGPAADTALQGQDFPRTDGEIVRLVDLDVVAHDGFDRVVLRFDQRVPSYQVALVEPPILQSGSGRVVVLAGAAFLQVHLSPATVLGYPDDPRPRTYQGPTRLRVPSGRVVTEAVVTGDVEATLVWTIALRHPAAFAAATTEDPPQLVIDVFSG